MNKNSEIKTTNLLRQRVIENIRISLFVRILYIFIVVLIAIIYPQNTFAINTSIIVFSISLIYFLIAWKTINNRLRALHIALTGAFLDVVFMLVMPWVWYIADGGSSLPITLVIKNPMLLANVMILLLINSYSLQHLAVILYSVGTSMVLLVNHFIVLNNPATILANNRVEHILSTPYDPKLFYMMFFSFVMTSIVIVLKLRRDEQLLVEFVGFEADLVDAIHERDSAIDKIESAYMETIERITKLTEYYDAETGQHIRRTRGYIELFCKELGLTEEDTKKIVDAAPLHDIGKIGIPDSILQKKGSLTAEEWEIMKTHALIGADALSESKVPVIEVARLIALSHHEKYNGQGYPYGLKGEEIPLPARIMAIVDVYDALRSKRPYKDGYDHNQTYKIIVDGDNKTHPDDFDPEILEIFKKNHEKFDEIYRNYDEQKKH